MPAHPVDTGRYLSPGTGRRKIKFLYFTGIDYFCELKQTQLRMKLFKLIFMVRFIKILEQIWSDEEGATSRLVPMKTAEDAQKINKDCHNVYAIS